MIEQMQDATSFWTMIGEGVFLFSMLVLVVLVVAVLWVVINERR